MRLKVAEHRGRFLAGAIMVPPPLVGRHEALFFYSGDETVFSGHSDILQTLGGDLHFLGEDPARALLYNTALLGLYWSTMVGFLHGAALVGTAGVPAEAFASTAAEFLTVPKQIMAYCARQIDGGNYSGEAGRLTMDATAIEHLVETSAAQGLAGTLPAFLHHLAQKAIDKGHGDDSFASIIEVLRQQPRTREGNGGSL
jgi:3-hydroxyisobutyrate dehydrogenase-like beta-hydroxyacid dehydrogenase